MPHLNVTQYIYGLVNFKFLRCYFMTFISYAQNFEDVLLWRALKHIVNGFYVDVGANDPVNDSVTMVFYKNHWRGINIEPIHDFYSQLCNERPYDINLEVAAGSEECDTFIYEIPNTGLSTLETSTALQQESNGWKIVKQPVHILPLNSILEEYAPPSIHFIKIDVEGYEQKVIDGLDLQKWRPWIILIESNKPGSADIGSNTWESSILESGYKLAYFDGLNKFFLADEHINLLPHFQIPPNVFDRFITNYQDNLQKLVQRLTSTIQDRDNQINKISFDFSEIQIQLNKSRDQVSELTTLLNTSQTKNFELISEMSLIHKHNYSLIKDLKSAKQKEHKLRTGLMQANNKIQDLNNELSQAGIKNNVLNKELNDTSAKIIQLGNLLNEANIKINMLYSELSYNKSELNKIHNSLSIRITAPLRTIYSARLKIKRRMTPKLEGIALRTVIGLRKFSWFNHTKVFLKKKLPTLWWFFRKVFLPSYTRPSTYTDALLSITNHTSSEPHKDEQHFEEFFLKEYSIRKNYSNKENS